jgi:eukaryotic-like serine/threonine-protein kinase
MIGQTLGHYRVVAKIAAGGMGIVYLAHDEHLDRDVALKVLPAGTIANEDSRKRFRQEALALAKLNHPNIETVHEFGSQEGIDYLAMELIAGQPLSEKLKEGPLAEHEILRLGTQFADGLAAAHERNIVHRDIKPGNLMVMPDGRLKILDFGLAKLLQPAVAADLTQSVETDIGKVAGTIPYMSPEQLRGRPVDQRSDIFAAGAVLYEMATGHRPFPQSQSVELMSAILHTNPESPSSMNAELSPGLESVIYKSLEKDPESRYHTARELKAALEGISATSHRAPFSSFQKTPPAAPTVLPQTETKFHALRAASTGISLLVVAGVLLGLNVSGVRDKLFHRKQDRSGAKVPSTAQVKSRKSIAVLGFKNVSGQRSKDWESIAMVEMFTTELGAGNQLRTVSGEDIAQMKMSLALADADTYGQETLSKIHKNLNADLIVLGSYIPLPDGETRIDVRLQDAINGTTLASISKKGRELDALVTAAGAELREKIGVAGVSLEESAEVQAAIPSTPEATQLYSEGIARLRAFDNVGARDLLQKAVIADPNSAMVHSALAEAYTSLGYDEKARQSGRNASDLSKPLSREDRLVIEGRYHATNKEWDHAVESYRTLFGYFPDNAEYGILMAESQISAGRGKDALDTIERLRNPASATRDDPRIDLAAADAALSLGNFTDALKQASSAAQKSRANGASLILARSLLVEAQALESLSQPADASKAANESRALYHAAKDPREQGTLEVEGNILADQGDLVGALQKYKEQLDITREIGNRHAEASAMNNMALVLKQQGDAVGARKMWQQSLLGFHDVSDKANSAQVLLNLGGVSLEDGNLTEAKKQYEQALKIFQDVNDSSGIANATAAIGTVLLAQGDCTEAKKLLEHAISIDLSDGRKLPPADKLLSLGDVLQLQGDLENAGKKYQDSLADANANGDKSNAAFALFGLGRLALLAGDFRSSREYLNRALAVRTGLGEKRTVAQTQVVLAQLTLEEGTPVDAISLASAARTEFERLRDPDDELAATAVLIRAYLANGSVDQAEKARDSTAAGVRNSQNLAARLDFAIVSAWLDGTAGKTTAANSRLEQVNSQAVKAKLVGYQLESKLTMAQINSKSSKTAESRIRLEELQREAADKGYVLISRKAATLGSA